jgi:type II secretory pathway predicted ATPase ExeA
MGARRITMPQLQRAKHQRQLFEEAVPAVPVRIQLPLSVQEQLHQALVQWMQALAKGIQKEDGNE